MSGDTPFRWALGLVFLTAMAISGYHRHKARRSGGGIRRSAESAGLIVARLGLALPLLLSLLAWLIDPAWMGWSRLSLPQPVRWAGVIAGLMAVPSVYWVVRTLGRNISETVLTRSDQQLVTRGPYRWVRHPLYTTGILLLSAAALMMANGFVAALTVVSAIVIRLVVIPKEEAALIGKFGARYTDYQTRTGALPPRIDGAARGGHHGPDHEAPSVSGE